MISRHWIFQTCVAVAIGMVFSIAQPVSAQIRWDGDTDLDWDTDANWIGGVEPGAADIAEINVSNTSPGTVELSKSTTISEFLLSFRSNSADYISGTSTLKVLPGANLQIASSNGSRIGRDRGADSVGQSKGQVIQSGGLVQFQTGSNGLRLSQNGTNLGDSYYGISGGSVLGGTLDSFTMTAPLQLGNGPSNWGLAQFHVIGSGASAIQFEDIRLFGSSTAGVASLRFSLDASGVTPMTAMDELRFAGTGTNQLVVDLIGEAPLTDIILIQADRFNRASSATVEEFTGMPDGTPISATYGSYQYNWNLRYDLVGGDDSDDTLDTFVRLQFVSRTNAVPEPSTFALLGLGAVSLIARRRRA